MPQAAVVAAAWVVKIGTAIVAAYKASAVVRMVIHIAAMFAVSAVSKALASKPGKINQGQELQLKLDPNMPRQVAVGRIATGGSQAWAFTYGDDSDVPNRYLVRIIPISDRPINGLVKVLEGDEELTFAGDPTLGLAPCLQHRKKDNSAAMELQVVLGSDTPTAVAWVIAASGGQWTSAHKGKGIAYVIVRYDYDPDAFSNGEPSLTFVVDGASVYDDREDVALGGDQELGDPETYEFSRNAAAIALQLLRGFYTGTSLIVGAQATSRDFESGQNIAALNTCDQAVPLAAGGTEPRYRAGMLLTASETTQSMLQDLKNAMDGEIYDRNGRIAILPGGVRTPVMDLTDEDIDWTVERSYQPIASLSSLYNHVVGTFVSEVLNFAQDSFPIKTDPAYVAQDGGEKITLSQDWRAVNSDTQIQRITTRVLFASRFQKIVAFTGPLWLYEIQQGDWFTMTSARWNFTSKYFNARLVTLSENLTVTIIAIETSPTIDGWSTADEVDRTSDSYTPLPYRVTPPYLAVSSYLVEDDDTNTKLPAIAVVISNFPGSPAGSYELQLRKAAFPDVITDLPSLNSLTTSTVISNGILPNIAYQLRARINVGDDFSDWTDWKNVTTVDTYTVEDSHRFGGRTYDEVWADVEDIAADASEALATLITIGDGTTAEAIDRIAVLRAQADQWATGLWDLSVGQDELRQYSQVLGYVDGEAVNAYAFRRTTEAFDGITAVVDDVALIGLANGDDTAFILNESTVEIGLRGSVATVLDALTAADEDAAASIVTESTARADGDTALATIITDLEVDLYGVSGSITLLQELTADLEDGINAVVGLAINVDGHITGYRFSSDGTTGSLIIQADEFQFVDPDDSGNVKVPFAYDGVNLIAQNMLIRNAVIEDLTIGTTKVQDFAISSKVIQYIAGSTTLTGTTRAQICTVSIATTGKRVDLFFKYYADFRVGGGSFTLNEEVVRYHNAIGSTPSPGTYHTIYSQDTPSPPISGADYIIGPQLLPLTDQPAAGTYTYTLWITFDTSGWDNQTASQRYSSAEEVKK